jgi:hypothetical protein
LGGTFPAQLQEGREVLINLLVEILLDYLATGYVAIIWRKVNVVSNPKPNKNSYCGTRDFRPISLTLFLLKTMESLVERFLGDEVLALRPLHPNQQAYQAGNSVDTELHQPVLRAEKTLDQQVISLSVFLDIEGACNDTSYGTMFAALRRHVVDCTILRWI